MRLRPFVAMAPMVLLAADLHEAAELSFSERVRAQEIIERIAWSHQIEHRRPFQEAVPPQVLEKKVRTYLAQSIALERFWNSPITDDALRAEAHRIAGGTLMPDRLRELYDALGAAPCRCWVKAGP